MDQFQINNLRRQNHILQNNQEVQKLNILKLKIKLKN